MGYAITEPDYTNGEDEVLYALDNLSSKSIMEIAEAIEKGNVKGESIDELVMALRIYVDETQKPI